MSPAGDVRPADVESTVHLHRGWPVVYDLLGDGADETAEQKLPVSLAGLSRAQVEMVANAAVDYLWRWTGRRFGLNRVTIHPCLSGCRPVDGMWPVAARAFLTSSGARPIGGCCPDGCSCGVDRSWLRLPGPINSVNSITVDHAALPLDSVEVVNSVWLHRLDNAPWPTCDGRLVIDYVQGLGVPAQGQLAAGLLALEMAKAINNDSSCKLPSRLQTVTRQGVSVAVMDNFDDLATTGKTGIWLVDSWVASVSGSSTLIISPDGPEIGPYRVRRSAGA